MARRLNQFEQFLALFKNLKAVAGEPKRLTTFFLESSAIREAAEKTQRICAQLSQAMSSGPKRFGRVPADFEAAWAEYRDRWSPAIEHASLNNFFEPAIKFPPYDPNDPYAAFPAGGQVLDPREPEPEGDDSFVPEYHDGWLALKLGIDYWRSEYDAYSERVRSGKYDDYDKLTANKCRIALDAFDYLMRTIGIDVADVFRRWRELPTIFMPPPVSNKHGEEKGSLNDLLDNAVRAFVCGAPAAAIAMCRAVLDMVVRDHYIPDAKDRTWTDKSGKEREKGLGDLIVLAEKRYEFLRRLKLAAMKDAGDEILHRYHRREPLSASDEKAIIDFMRTLKTVIQNVNG